MDGMSVSEKNARITWRMESVEMIRTMPSRCGQLGGDGALAHARSPRR